MRAEWFDLNVRRMKESLVEQIKNQIKNLSERKKRVKRSEGGLDSAFMWLLGSSVMELLNNEVLRKKQKQLDPNDHSHVSQTNCDLMVQERKHAEMGSNVVKRLYFWRNPTQHVIRYSLRSNKRVRKVITGEGFIQNDATVGIFEWQKERAANECDVEVSAFTV